MNSLQHPPILIIDKDLYQENSSGQAILSIKHELENLGFVIIATKTFPDALDLIKIHEEISCIIIDWETSQTPAQKKTYSCTDFIKTIRNQNEKIPIYIMTHRAQLQDIETKNLMNVNGYLWKIEDTPGFIAGRIKRAIENYYNAIMPPFFKTLVDYVKHYKYAWHTPGHMGGVAFLKSPIGRIFYDFYGENTFRADLSVSVPELGSLMEHSGVNGEAERCAAKTFGADYTFFVTNGTSTANKIVSHSCVTQGDIVIVDRNCHKSLQHALTMTGAIPIYFMPARNAYGIIGGIHHDEFTPKEIKRKIKESPLIKNKKLKPKLAVITNSTYDGLAYDVVYIKEQLQDVVNHLHFDEAWFPYAKFHELYTNRFGMCSAHEPQHPTVYSTQSTHKLLAAFSQASMVHVKNGAKPIDPNRFNEAFMMHTSTSPQYNIIASLDVATKMMEGAAGRHLIHESTYEAIVFRKKMRQIEIELEQQKDIPKKERWFFKIWQPNSIKKHSSLKKAQEFQLADDHVLTTDQKCWLLQPGDEWHGYHQITKNYMMLDPIKVSILTPGINTNGTMKDEGIPAPLLAKFLVNRGIVDEKTGFYSFLLLFSIGVSRGKSSILLSRLLEFKKLFDQNISINEIYPDLVKSHPEKYKNLSLQQLAFNMHRHLKEKNITKIMSQVFDQLPEPVITPQAAYQELVRGNVETTKLTDLIGRVAAVMLVPYPPGIPIIMPGERFSKKSKLVIDYLKLLEDFDNRFPGFETETHGVTIEVEEGRKVYYVNTVVV